MQFELVLLSTLVVYHLLLSLGLIGLLGVGLALFKPSAEMKSWLWCASFFVASLLPMYVVGMLGSQYSAVPNESSVASDVAVLNASQLNAHPSISSNPTLNNSISNRSDSNNSGGLSIVKSAPLTTKLGWALPTQVLQSFSGLLVFLVCVWAVGCVWRGHSLLRSIRQANQIRSRSRPFKLNLVVRAEKSSKWVRVSEQVQSPMVLGVLNPVIVLPTLLIEKLSQEQLTAVVLHEQAHIDRRDSAMSLAVEILLMMFWWSPFARAMNKQLKKNRELACDMRAAHSMSDGKQYAQALVDCAQLMLVHRQNLLSLNLFSKKKELTKRVQYMLTFNSTKKSAMSKVIIGSVLFTLGSVVIANTISPHLEPQLAGESSQKIPKLSREKGEALISFAAEGDIQNLTMLLDSGVNVNSRVLGEGTALISAIRSGNASTVKALLDLGADPNLSSPGDANPMIIAAARNRQDLVDMLIAYGADIDSVVLRDGTPLIAAIRSKHDALAEYLIEQGADVNQSAQWDGNPLIAAANRGNVALATLLIDRGADVNSVMETDDTPLINAVRRGHLDVATLLVENGADVNLGVHSKTMFGTEYRTPLNSASTEQLREYLKQAGATE